MDKLTTLLACLPKSPFKDNLTEEIESLRQQLAAAKETDLLLRNLLCVIHRDGGHHITAHGLDQSVQDAMEVFYNLRDLPEQLAAALAACEERAKALRWYMPMMSIEHQDRINDILAIKPDASALKAHDDALIERIVGHLCENGFGNQNTFDAIRVLKTEV